MDANTWSKIDNIYMVGKILLHMVSKFIPDLDESLYLFGPTILWDMMRMLCISTWKVIMILIMSEPMFIEEIVIDVLKRLFKLSSTDAKRLVKEDSHIPKKEMVQVHT
ncbi:hypothetical protein CK203_054317 [Vitis vinifera]|uniref:Uncharacterized protein n=1 Tax=Vitis vinifera TaxID=29760 RepID=A0A438GZY0_VITVI|nr:hypothetical protein CK203_054317 [Vitis vinifera]